MLIVDQFGQPLLIGLVADIPGYQPRQFRHARTRTGIGHFLQPEVERVSKERGQQQRPVGRLRVAFQMSEVPGEVGPLIDLE
jgi:hypothetical protein